MLQSDKQILEILQKEQKNNELLGKFHIDYPSRRVAQESNSIFVAAVDAENSDGGFDYIGFYDLVEVLIVTKKKEQEEAIKIIRTAAKEIIKAIYRNADKFETRPIVRNVTLDYNNRDFVVTRGHLLVKVSYTEDIEFNVDYEECVRVLSEDLKIKTK